MWQRLTKGVRSGVPKRLPDHNVDRIMQGLFAIQTDDVEVAAKRLADSVVAIAHLPDGPCLNDRLGLHVAFEATVNTYIKKFRGNDWIRVRYKVDGVEDREFVDFDDLFRWCEVYFGLRETSEVTIRGAVVCVLANYMAYVLQQPPLPTCLVATVRSRDDLERSFKVLTEAVTDVATVDVLMDEVADTDPSEIANQLKTYMDGVCQAMFDGPWAERLSRLPGMPRGTIAPHIVKACAHMLQLARFGTVSLDNDVDGIVRMGRIALGVRSEFFAEICKWTQVWGVFRALRSKWGMIMSMGMGMGTSMGMGMGTSMGTSMGMGMGM